MYCIDISNVFRNVMINLGINISIVNVLYLSNGICIYMYVKYIYNENILKFLYKYFNYNIYI